MSCFPMEARRGLGRRMHQGEPPAVFVHQQAALVGAMARLTTTQRRLDVRPLTMWSMQQLPAHQGAVEGMRSHI